MVSELHAAAVRWAERLPAWASAALIGVLLAGAWLAVYAAGGTRTAWPHLFYVPVLAATVPFGAAGGVVTGLAAMLLCGPAMPLDVATGEAQRATNWLARGGFFVAIGALSGASLQALRSSFEHGLAAWFRHELERATTMQPPDPDLHEQLDQVLSERRFHAVFQPIYSLEDARLVAVEALTRFDVDPYRPPNVWFEQAAAVGRGVDLELAAIDTALTASAELAPHVTLTVNASPDTLADPRLLALLEDHPHRRLIVEVTEHHVIDDYHRLDGALDALRRRGVQLAVDDAGAGFASLRHIVRLAPEFIKLDDSLTRDVRSDPVRRALASSLVDFSRQIGSQLITEGIEEPGDLAAWQELGAHAAQGYLLARPGPLPVLEVCPMIPVLAPDPVVVRHTAGRRRLSHDRR